MASFQGGSAYAMVREIAGGFLAVTDRSFIRYAPSELQQLDFEITRLQTDLRGAQSAADDLPAIQKRNRQLQRLNTARMILRSYRQKSKK